MSLGSVNKLGNEGIEMVALFDKDGKRLGYTNSNLVGNIPDDVMIDASNYSEAVKNVNLVLELNILRIIIQHPVVNILVLLLTMCYFIQ